MFRRLPTFLSLAFVATVGLFALTTHLTAQPAPSATTPGDGPGVKRNQEENLKLFKRFSEEVLRLAQKWEKSDNNEEKERAKSLRAALKVIEEKGVEKLFKGLVEGLNSRSLEGSDFGRLLGDDKKLIAALEEILDVLNTEDELARIQREIADLKKAIAAIQELKRKQENVRARTDSKRGDPDKLAKDQKDLAAKTQDTANALDKGNKDNKGNPNAGGDKPDPKAETKAESKPGDNTAEAKPETKENKADGKGDGMPMGGDSKPGDPKPGSPMGGMPAGADKPSPKEGAGDAKAGEPKPSGEPKAPMDSGEPKPMSGDSKSQGSGKGESKPSAGMPGGEGKPMGGDGAPMEGGGMPSPGGSKGGGSPSSGGSQNKPKDPAAQEVQQAVPQQQGAEEDIKKGDPKEASKKQDKAIDQLEKALAELEKRLKQLREKELAKLLQNLEERVSRMLRMQMDVKASTEGIDKTVKALGGKPAVAEIQKSQAQADRENAIIAEAEKTLKLMEGEGTAVVFAGVLSQVKGDMEAIQKRLNEARVGEDTQQIEQDVIDQLKMMLEALKKAKQDLENKPSEPKPNDPNAKKPDNKLLELLAELKLIKFQQETLNRRTIMHNKQDPGEQARDALVQTELARLAANQKVLQEMLHKIATQANQ
ncbi:hypothetical protein [Frigoriglobus tundricola]|uniref:Uncharacterized protein n=1 Tax=Frigoriglobus tundricola TaxID=2774151 RepID=A0A6M5YHT8_9BACT|nr:hypothetical protein [Frigoriglobus tundricola]QJW93528.1 hypothetical protein FTUN_1035 [Frigoriglobus tundricola]